MSNYFHRSISIQICYDKLAESKLPASTVLYRWKVRKSPSADPSWL